MWLPWKLDLVMREKEKEFKKVLHMKELFEQVVVVPLSERMLEVTEFEEMWDDGCWWK